MHHWPWSEHCIHSRGLVSIDVVSAYSSQGLFPQVVSEGSPLLSYRILRQADYGKVGGVYKVFDRVGDHVALMNGGTTLLASYLPPYYN